MSEGHKHLGLTRWPFPVVPNPEHCTFLADRDQVKADVGDLLRFLSRRDTSSIHLFWAWFGAGKTHTLYYLVNQASALNGTKNGNRLRCIYSEFPKSARGFIDLYQSFVAELGVEELIMMYLEAMTAPGSGDLAQDLLRTSPDLAAALKVVATGRPEDQANAMRWLRGDDLPVSQCRSVGASHKLKSAEDACRIIVDLKRIESLAAESLGYSGYRLIWILDEYQRIERLTPKVREGVNTALHSIFNASPEGLSLILSFSGKPEEKTRPPWLTEELASRIGRTKVMVLPPLQPAEAMGFVRDVLAKWRMPEFKRDTKYFPFSKDACMAIIEEAGQNGELKPRDVMSAFSAVLEQAESKLEAGEIKQITADLATSILKEYVNLAQSSEDD